MSTVGTVAGARGTGCAGLGAPRTDPSSIAVVVDAVNGICSWIDTTGASSGGVVVPGVPLVLVGERSAGAPASALQDVRSERGC